MVTVCPFSTPVVSPETMTAPSSSAALMRSSSAIVSMVIVGTVRSSSTVVLAWPAGLPAWSDTSAVTVSMPSDSAWTLAAGTATDQALADTVVVTGTPPKLTVTVWPGSTPVVVPETVTSLNSSVALTRSSPETVSIAIVGAVLSTVNDSSPVRLPSPAPPVPSPPSSVVVDWLVMLSSSTRSRPTSPSKPARSPPETVTV